MYVIYDNPDGLAPSASRTPAPLQHLCEAGVAKVMLSTPIPAHEDSYLNGPDNLWSCFPWCGSSHRDGPGAPPVPLDTLLTDQRYTHKRERLLIILSSTKTAWDNWLSVVPVFLQRRVRLSLARLLQELQLPTFYGLLLNILTATELSAVVRVENKNQGASFANILEGFQIFHIKNLNYSFDIDCFEIKDPKGKTTKETIDPLAIILKKSINLKSLHLHYKNKLLFEFISPDIRYHCRNLEVIIIDFHIKECHLYELFFSGAKMECILSSFNCSCEIIPSFPLLKQCSLAGFYEPAFFQTILYYYKNLYFLNDGKSQESIMISTLLVNPENLKSVVRPPSDLKSVSFGFHCSHVVEQNLDIVNKLLPSLDHLCLFINHMKHSEIDTFKFLLTKYKIKSLSLNFQDKLDIDHLFNILYLCGNLHTLKVLTFSEKSTVSQEKIKPLPAMYNLSKLTVYSPVSNKVLDYFLLHICSRAPNLNELNVDLPNLDAVVSLVTEGGLNSLRKMVFDISALRSQRLPELVEMLPSLQTLVIHNHDLLRYSELSKFCRKAYSRTALRVSIVKVLTE